MHESYCLAATEQAGNDPPDDAFTVRNAGPGTINYSISASCGWLSFVPDSDSSSGETDTITVDYDTTGLGEGQHVCTVTVSAPEAVQEAGLARVLKEREWTVTVSATMKTE